jgi:hypothetical protein
MICSSSTPRLARYVLNAARKPQSGLGSVRRTLLGSQEYLPLESPGFSPYFLPSLQASQVNQQLALHVCDCGIERSFVSANIFRVPIAARVQVCLYCDGIVGSSRQFAAANIASDARFHFIDTVAIGGQEERSCRSNNSLRITILILS